jgi:enediyne biosynthesis protein E3
MSDNNKIFSKMENIKTVFQDAKDFFMESKNTTDCIHYLEKTNLEFRSVAYEGASMALALKALSENDYSLKDWNSFLSNSKNQAGNIHIGLGWAIAESKPNDLSFLNSIHPMMLFRVWDGCGYYDGIFRQRQTIKNQIRQEYNIKADGNAYDEGIGRSIWYHCKGNVPRVVEMIHSFSSDRFADLWRGIGIASVYVGGNREQDLEQLFLSSEKYSLQLAIGAAMVAKARLQTKTITTDVELACKSWCKLNPEEAMNAMLETESSTDSFESLLLKMEVIIQNSRRLTKFNI